MAFDGRGYVDAQFGFPVLNHPRGPLTGPSFAHVLQSAYFYARNHGRIIIRQHYPMSFREPYGSRDRMVVNTVAYARIAEGRRYLPDETTHLVGEAVFSILKSGSGIDVFHRVVVADGGSSDTGTATQMSVDVTPDSVPDPAIGATADLLVRFVATGFYVPYGPRPNTYTARFEVPLATVAAGAGAEIYVEAYASRAASYFPQMVSVWTEIR